MNKTNYIALFLITLIGGYLRFNELGLRPVFVDEALFGLWVRLSFPTQEWLPILLTKLMPDTEFGLRFLFALSGTLTIPAVFIVVKHQKLLASFIVATFPLFVFWSKLSRPYAMAGLFIVLGWRWFWFYIPALLCTPIALLGIKIIKQKWFVLVAAVLVSVILFYIRPDTERFTNQAGLEMWMYSSRFWYLPALALLLYLFEFKIKFVQIGLALITLFLAFETLPNIDKETDVKWYRREVRFADWRNVGEVDYGTNLLQSWYYTGHEPKYFRAYNFNEFIKDIQDDTLIVGIDYLITTPIAVQLFNNDFTYWKVKDNYYPIVEFLKHNMQGLLFAERVYKFKAYLMNEKIIMESI